jgi:hypothetical protein
MRNKSFETAAARRRKDPIVWNIDGHEIKLRASVQMDELADAVDELSKDVEGDNALKVAEAKRHIMLDILRAFVEKDSVKAVNAVADDLDVGILDEMLTELIAEYMGSGNPTKPSSSSVGSSTDGETSMPTAPNEE